MRVNFIGVQWEVVQYSWLGESSRMSEIRWRRTKGHFTELPHCTVLLVDAVGVDVMKFR